MCEEKGEEPERRIKEARARTRAAHTRRAMLALLRRGPMSGAELRAALPGELSMAVVNYHLSVLAGDGEVVNESGVYRLA